MDRKIKDFFRSLLSEPVAGNKAKTEPEKNKVEKAASPPPEKAKQVSIPENPQSQESNISPHL